MEESNTINGQKRIMMFGLSGAGKTSILNHWRSSRPSLRQPRQATVPAAGIDLLMMEHDNVCFNIWHLSKHTTERMFFNRYYQDTSAIIFVIDSTDRASIDNNNTKEELLRVVEEPQLRQAVVLICANKQDLLDALNVDELISRLQLHSLLTENNRKWHIEPTSTKNGAGLIESFHWLAKTISTI